MQVETQEIFTMNPKELDLHPLALSTPRMNDDNYTALKIDIEANGQLEPVVLYRGRILDGRHRWLILQELGIQQIRVIKLPNNTTVKQLKQYVNSKEIRRHESISQLAIRAYRLILESDVRMTQGEAGEFVGVARRYIGYCKAIAETYKRPDILNSLFEGMSINVGTEYAPIKTDKLPAIIEWLKGNTVTKKSEDTRGKVEMTEDQFIESQNKYNELIGLDIKVIKHLTSKLYSHVKEYEDAIRDSKDD